MDHGMAPPRPEIVADCECHTGENPLWHPEERRLYWTDIPRGRLFRYNPATGANKLCHAGPPLGGFTIQADGALLLFMARGAIAIWRGGALEEIVPEIPAERATRFNDVIADPAGRVFAGTMGTPQRKGRLYRLDPDRSLHVILEDTVIPNGMAFTPDHRQMYYTDSSMRRIFRFDYDSRTGDISNRKVWLETPPGRGAPDGMTVDTEGCVWSARWNDSALYRYSPEGEELLRIPFPARKVSSVTFGGERLDELYITTALTDGTRAEEGAGAGAVFRFRPGVAGLPECRSRIGF
jgi:D-xylono/L-arabinono-1,4-lactonase